MEEIVTEAVAEDRDVAAVKELGQQVQRIRAELAKVIHGQEEIVEKLLCCIFAGGHALLMGVPGLAKTLMVRSLADVISLEFNRIQFTPDLMPSDITGTEILQDSDIPGARGFQFVQGPIFSNIILADEINRTPPKTQAALLEAMQEYRVTAMGKTYDLDQPFFVLATQNPIEQEGTYPLPEAQLDRFMFFITLDYPSLEDERKIARTTTGLGVADLEKVIDGPRIRQFQELVRRIPVPDHIYDYVVKLVRASRPGDETAPDWVEKWVTWGAGPRAVQYLILGGKARAALTGSYLVRAEDINAITDVVLSHRILLNFRAESEGVTPREVVRRLVTECED